MSDLNKRLQLGPQGVKKEESPKEEEIAEEQEKAPLSDARKGRARGPQRRAPAKSPSAAAASEAKPAAPVLSFSLTQTVWSIDPDDGDFSCSSRDESLVKEAAEAEEPSSALEPAQAPAIIPEETKDDGHEDSKLSDEIAAPASASNAEEPEAPNVDPVVTSDTPTEDTKAEGQEGITLASNTAGDSVLEATVKKDDGKVEPVEVQDDAK
jgi:hypothetical protein